MTNRVSQIPTEQDQTWYQECVIKGRPRKDVAKESGVSVTILSRGVQKAAKWFANQFADRIQTSKSQAIARLELLWAETYQQWVASIDRTEETIKVVEGIDKEGNPISKVERIATTKLGDVRYVNALKEILSDMCRITGDFAPTQTESFSLSVNANIEAMSDEDGQKVMEALRAIDGANDPVNAEAQVRFRPEDREDRPAARRDSSERIIDADFTVSGDEGGEDSGERPG